jgi:catalase
MNVLSDLGIPRNVRHISGNGVHTFRFVNGEGKSQLFEWFWLPALGHRSLVYDEVTKIQGKNNNFQRIDLLTNIEAGVFPEWDFVLQIFDDDGSYMYEGYDLLIPTVIVPFEVNPPIRLGKLTLNRNPSNFFAELEAISFAPSNVVDGVSFVPDPLLQWRLMSYDDTATHRHHSPNGDLLPINRAVSPVNNSYRDGYMQPLIFQGPVISTPSNLGGVQEPGQNATLSYTAAAGEQAGSGPLVASRQGTTGLAKHVFSGDLSTHSHSITALTPTVSNSAMSPIPLWCRITSTTLSTTSSTVLPAVLLLAWPRGCRTAHLWSSHEHYERHDAVSKSLSASRGHGVE